MLVVIPCYNEAERLREDLVLRLLDDARVRVLLVDDGSTDATAGVLARICERAPAGRASSFSLAKNSGKAEAVRQGMLRALENDSIVGYLDADFATPPEEAWRLLDAIEEQRALVVLGARIAMLGARIDRKASRHYLGRVFATVASIVLDEVVYDTQCGAKLFRDGPALRAALAAPFSSRWSFDVELLGRLLAGGVGREQIVEVPLRTWIDVGGSKLRPTGALKAGMDLLRLGARVKLRGREGFFPDR